MFYGNQVQETRRVFFDSFKKYQLKQPLEPLEQQVVEVILEHPEYHRLLNSGEALHQSFLPEFGESNPFLHMGLHLAIREQVATNRPAGMSALYEGLLKKWGNVARVDHQLMDYLVDCLWQAQKNQTMPDESAYWLACEALL